MTIRATTPRSDVRRHATLPQSWIQRENWQFETHRRFRDECLNEHWFTTLAHAQAVIEAWRCEYNEERPKKGLGGLTPALYAALLHENLLRVRWLGPHFSGPSAGATLRGCSRRFIPGTRRSTALRTGRPITRLSFDAANIPLSFVHERPPDSGHLRLHNVSSEVGISYRSDFWRLSRLSRSSRSRAGSARTGAGSARPGSSAPDRSAAGTRSAARIASSRDRAA